MWCGYASPHGCLPPASVSLVLLSPPSKNTRSEYTMSVCLKQCKVTEVPVIRMYARSEEFSTSPAPISTLTGKEGGAR